jgi:biopolymer transport protein ExbD
MRLPTSYHHRDEDIDVTMTPMIDVVFLLLVFFVWTASFLAVEYSLPSELSTQAGTQQVDLKDPPPDFDIENIVIRIIAVGSDVQWSINSTLVASKDELRQLIQGIAQTSTEAPIILHPDSQVSLGPVIEVYDMAKMAGFQKVSFAVNPN